MAITVAAIDAIRAQLATIPPKDETAREVSRQDAMARMSTEVWPCGRVNQTMPLTSTSTARVAANN
jgi:hypothetical protein